MEGRAKSYRMLAVLGTTARGFPSPLWLLNFLYGYSTLVSFKCFAALISTIKASFLLLAWDDPSIIYHPPSSSSLSFFRLD